MGISRSEHAPRSSCTLEDVRGGSSFRGLRCGVRLLVASAGVGAFLACNALTGIDDLYTGPMPDGGMDATVVTVDGQVVIVPGDAGSTCTGNRANCDGNAANQCEVDLSTDPRNCGRCGHSCLPGTCAGGLCQAGILSAATDGRKIALDATNVYWMTPTTVVTCPKTGCVGAPTTLLSSPQPLVDFALGATEFFVVTTTTEQEVQRCAKTGCAVATKVDGAPLIGGIAANANTLVWTRLAAAGSLLTCTLPACLPVSIADNLPAPDRVAVDATAVYVATRGSPTTATSGTLRFCLSGSCGGTPSVQKSTIGATTDLLVDGAQLFAAVPDRILGCPKTGSCEGAAPFVTLASVRALAIDSKNLYYANSSIIRSCPRAACPAPVLVANAGGVVLDMVADEAALYWVGSSGVRVMPK